MIKWKLKGKDISSIKQFPEGAIGFIYIISFSNGMKYIGRKNLYSTRKKPFGKKKLSEIKDNRVKKYEIVVKESNWQTYNSSNSEILNGLKSGELQIESRDIIKICFTDKQMTYYESQALFCYGVIEEDSFYNDNILGKFYRRDLNGKIDN